MVQPCKGASREKLLELYSKRIFYYIGGDARSKKGVSFEPCILSRDSEWTTDKPRILFFDEDMCPFRCDMQARWENLYDSWTEAEKKVNHIKKLYSKGFWRKPYVSIDTLEKYKGEMVRIEKLINKGLKDYPNFLGIDFCDVHANGIQVRGHHKEIEKYIYGMQPTIKYDFTNKNEVISDFIEMWKHEDTPEELKRIKEFLKSGEKYGWE